MDEVKKVYNLKIKEIIVLLAMKGCKNVIGLFGQDEISIDSKSVNEVFFSMVKKKIVKNDNGKLYVDKELDDILNIIVNSNRTIIVSHSDDTLAENIVYVKNGQCVYAQSQAGEDSRMLTIQLGCEEAVEQLISSGFKIESYIDRKGIQEVELNSESITLDLNNCDKDQLCEIDGFLHVAIMYDELNDNKKTQLILVNQNLDDYIVCMNDEEIKTYNYSRECVGKCLMDLMEGDII